MLFEWGPSIAAVVQFILPMYIAVNVYHNYYIVTHLPPYNVWGSMGVTVCITNHDALDVLKSHSQVWSINTDISASINGPSSRTELKYNIYIATSHQQCYLYS